MKGIIAGAGIAGMTAVHLLLDAGISPVSVRLIDARAEVGSPVSGPGWLEQKNWVKKWVSWNVDIDAISLMEMETGIAFRRESIEKELGISLASRGVHLNLKQRITAYQVEQDRIRLLMNGIEESCLVDWVIDHLGCQPITAGRPGDSALLRNSNSSSIITTREQEQTEIWLGGIIPSNTALLPNNGLQFERADGTIEYWTQELELPSIQFGWTELMQRQHPQVKENSGVGLSIDAALVRAQTSVKKLQNRFELATMQ